MAATFISKFLSMLTTSAPPIEGSQPILDADPNPLDAYTQKTLQYIQEWTADSYSTQIESARQVGDYPLIQKLEEEKDKALSGYDTTQYWNDYRLMMRKLFGTKEQRTYLPGWMANQLAL
jgi:hypothetical protein